MIGHAGLRPADGDAVLHGVTRPNATATTDAAAEFPGALEPFDAIGHLRAEDRGSPIDARGQMYDGTTVDGPAGVRTFLLKHQDQYLRNVTENLMTYALGPTAWASWSHVNRPG